MVLGRFLLIDISEYLDKFFLLISDRVRLERIFLEEECLVKFVKINLEKYLFFNLLFSLEGIKKE